MAFSFQDLARGFFERWVIQIYVRNLMVGHRKGSARSRVQNLQA